MNKIPANDAEHDPRLTAIYRAAASEEPSSALDDAVQAAAHRAVSARPQSATPPRWRLPLATAALIVLSASLLLTIRQESPPEMAPAFIARPEVPAAPAAAKNSDNDSAARPGVAEAPVAAKAPMPMTAPASSLSARQASNRMPTAPALAETPPTVSSGAITDAATPQAASNASFADRLSSERKAKAESALPLISGTAAASPPESWLEQIMTLRRQGQINAAKNRFAEFRKRYPDYPIPAALKDWASLTEHPTVP